jgi:60 kDa SS-A/Ro ribonucleoprotein
MKRNPYSANLGVVSTRKTPQSQPVIGKKMIQNVAGGYVFEASDWDYLDRFLIIGTAGGSYYVNERKLTEDGLKLVAKCLANDGKRTVDRIVDISKSGRAPKNDSAIAALAIAAAAQDSAIRVYALSKLPQVCRTGTHLFQFSEIVNELRGWGRSLTTGIRKWYIDQPTDKVAFQAIKYQQREGWSHRDLLRLAHPRTLEADRNALFAWVTHDTVPEQFPKSLRILEGFLKAQKATTSKEIVTLISDYDLSREMIPTQFLTDPAVWEAMLPKMGMTAMIRNLANMTRIGLVTDLSDATKTILARLKDQDQLKRARIHPVNVLIAEMTYRAGRGMRGQNVWNPVGKIVSALDDAFYASFGFIPATGKNLYLGLDVSGSMSSPEVNGIPGLSPYVLCGAMAMTTIRTEPNWTAMAFCHQLVPTKLHARMSLNEVVSELHRLGRDFGGTDCALPMIDATNRKLPIDGFVIYTDTQTWAGHTHPFQALKTYRQKMGRNAKMIEAVFVAYNTTLTDAQDPGMLSIVGFDSSVPNLIADFVTEKSTSTSIEED